MTPYDLSKHGVIQASAGTGKTYAIEQIVLRLLRERQTPLAKILIVTFTEKAAAELRARLRAALEKALASGNDDGPRRVVQEALDDFDQASIATIHGFCQRVLREFPLEQGQDFSAELVDDGALRAAALREVQRRDWRQWLGPHLEKALELAGYDRDTASSWEKQVLEITARHWPGKKQCLLPPCLDGWPERGLADAVWSEECRAHLPKQLLVRTVQGVLDRVQETKLRHGWQSYDDMLRRVQNGLDPLKNAGSAALASELRNRYHVGIVDEFQDTDHVQWDIFRRIFLEAGTGQLFVVGDPKQAIYSFRGADLHAYLQALSEMKAPAAVQYTLATNWRSCPQLLDALNKLFTGGAWFHANPLISYQDVQAPKEIKDQRNRLARDDSQRGAVTLVDWTAQERWKIAQRRHGEFIADEIDRLLHGNNGGPMMDIAVEQKSRPLAPGDVCVLVFRRAEAEPVVQALKRRGIPYTFYKQSGLWSSEEVLHLRYVLEALVAGHDPLAFRKALLTDFFRVRPEELSQCEVLPPSHPARLLFQKWAIWAERQEWGPLFQSLREDTGLFVETSIHLGGERRRANWRTIFNTLEQAGYQQQLDLRGLLAVLRNLNQATQPDSDLQPIETERPKVRIMTIHISKGLEFPVVFLAGGFTQSSRHGIIAYHDADERLVYDLTPADEAKQCFKQERLDEQRRLLYVALTRAMFKLYVPMVGLEKGKANAAYAGPAVTLLKPALQSAKLETLDPKTAQALVAPPWAGPRLDAAPPAEVLKDRIEWQTGSPLVPTLAGDMDRRRIVVRSFSSQRRAHEQQAPVQFGEDHERAEDEALLAPPTDDPWRGVVFGDLVHQVLEQIDFAEVGRASTPADLLAKGPAAALVGKLVDRNVTKLTTRLPREIVSQTGRAQVASLVWHALHTPLAALGGPLHEVSEQDRLTELEFLFPEENAQKNIGEDAHWTGFMDLVFRRNGKLFLLDWKTNLLPGYGPDDLARSMADSDYHRQYGLYLQALVRWLARAGKRALQIAGVYYLYVRGLNGRDESSGVFFHAPTPAELKHLH